MLRTAHIAAPWLGLLTLLCGCGGEVEAGAGGAGGVWRLDPRPVAPYPVAELAVAARFAVEGPELPAGWSVSSGADPGEVVHETRERFGGPWYGLSFPGAKGFTVRISGPHDPRAFNRVALHLATRDKVDISIAFHDKSGSPVRTPWVRYAGDGRPQTVMIDVFETILREDPFRFLAVQVRCIRNAPAILGLDLLHTSVTALAPGGAHAGDPVSLQLESRTSWGLPLGVPLEARATLPAGDLRFGFARPIGLSPPKDRLSVRVKFSVGAEQVGVEAFSIPRPKQREEEWHEASVPVPAGAVGRDTTIRFELVSNSKRESAAVISSPRIERKGLDPPTVVLVTSDTHRADHLGIADDRSVGGGGVGVSTPFLDSLAAQGVYFANCYSSTNITNPSHGALLTALPIRDTGIHDNITLLSPEASTLAELFQASGWRTLASVSAEHMRHEQSGLGQGFDRMSYPSKDYRDSTETIAHLEGMLAESEGLPVFAWLHVFDAHGPYEVPEDYRWLYYDRDRDPYSEDLPQLPAGAQAPWDRQARDVDFIRSQYKAEVTYLDDRLARFFEEPRMQRAVVALTADHGECLGERDNYYTHRALLPATLDVPLILRWPGAPAGTRIEAPVTHLDVGRTLLDLANLAQLEFPGRNLLNWIEDPEQGPRARFGIGSHATEAGIEEDGWYLRLWLSTTTRGRQHQVELYHIAEDPRCETDLVETEFERARAMRARLIEWLDAASTTRLATSSGAPDAESLSGLAELGYAESSDGGVTDGPWYVPDPSNPWCKRFSR